MQKSTDEKGHYPKTFRRDRKHRSTQENMFAKEMKNIPAETARTICQIKRRRAPIKMKHLQCKKRIETGAIYQKHKKESTEIGTGQDFMAQKKYPSLQNQWRDHTPVVKKKRNATGSKPCF